MTTDAPADRPGWAPGVLLTDGSGTTSVFLGWHPLHPSTAIVEPVLITGAGLLEPQRFSDDHHSAYTRANLRTVTISLYLPEVMVGRVVAWALLFRRWLGATVRVTVDGVLVDSPDDVVDADPF